MTGRCLTIRRMSRDEEFRQVLAHFGLTEQQALAHYDTVLHLVSCAKGAEFAYNFGNEARYEPLEDGAGKGRPDAPRLERSIRICT